MVSSSVVALWLAAVGALLSGSTVMVMVAVGLLAPRGPRGWPSVTSMVKWSMPVKPVDGV